MSVQSFLKVGGVGGVVRVQPHSTPCEWKRARDAIPERCPSPLAPQISALTSGAAAVLYDATLPASPQGLQPRKGAGGVAVAAAVMRYRGEQGLVGGMRAALRAVEESSRKDTVLAPWVPLGGDDADAIASAE